MTDTYHLPGVRLAAGHAGFYAGERPDVAVLELAPGSECAVAWTRNRFRAAPILVADSHRKSAQTRLLLVNAGCANAGLGQSGVADAMESCAVAAAAFGVTTEEVLPFSTGEIGKRLEVDRFRNILPDLAGRLREDSWEEAAEAIRTTDTFAKCRAASVHCAGRDIRVVGMAKGSGMICPDMATMLAFVATDLAVPGELLEHVLERVLDTSFHAITVDGDTSPNDSCVLIATGASEVSLQDLSDEEIQGWESAVREVCEGLAQDIVRDGEGATRFVTIEITGATSTQEAWRVARAIAHSPLVKTAIFAGDPNWGRILSAIGRSVGTEVPMDQVSIWFDEVAVVIDGCKAEDYREEAATRVMEQKSYVIRADLGSGSEQARLHTSDLSYDYVRINAEYRS